MSNWRGLILKTVAIIPARAGSKGIKNKNILPILGKPLVEWSIKAAIESAYIDEVVVSTDSPEVMEIAKSYGVTIRKRPLVLCGDKATTESALLDVLDNCMDFEIGVLLQPTSPIRTDGLIDNIIMAMLEKEGCDSALTGYAHTPFFFRKKEDGFYEASFNPAKRKMRQDIKDSELYYHDDGNVYCFTASALRAYNSRIGRNVLIYPTSYGQSLQIDDLKDIDLINFFAKKNNWRSFI